MTAPVFDQDTFEGRNDDVGLNSATFNGGGGPGGDWSQDTDANFRVRFLIQETNGGMSANQNLALYYEKNGDGNPTGSSAVTTSSSNVILVNDTQGIADNETTTQVIGGGTYVSGDAEGYDDGTSDVGTGNIDFTGNTEVEVEFCIQIVGADVSDGDTIDLYVFEADATQLGSYTDAPRVTAKKPLTISESDSATPGESTSVTASAPQVSASEAITVVDIPRYYADAIILGEAVTVSVEEVSDDKSVSVSDSATPGESVSVVLSAPQISETDAISVGESANLEQAHSVGETDSATPSEATTVTTSAPQIDETEAVAPAESVNLEQAYSIAESDSATPDEAPDLATSAPQIDEADAVSIGESVNLEHAYNVGEADSITVGEAATAATSDPQIDEAEAVSAAESTNLELAHHVAVSDSAAVGEDNVSVVVGALQPRTISVSDSATPSDVATVANSSLPLSSADSAAPGESTNLEQAHNVTEADSITLGESASLEVGALQPQEISESDAISVGESAGATVSAPQIDEADAVSVGEDATVATDALLISEAESVSLGESTNLELAYHASVSSAATASDSSPTAELTIEVVESETVSTADATTLTASAPQVTATDAISVGELSSVDIPGFGDRNVSVSETVSLGESTDLEIVFVIVEAEAVALTESATAAIPGYVLLGSLNYTNVPFDDRRSAVEYEEDRASVPFEDHRSGA